MSDQAANIGKRFFYLYNNNWDHEIASYQRGEVPSHRLFGLAELQKLGHSVFTSPAPKFLSRFLARPLFWRIYQGLYAVRKQKKFDYIIAVHEAAALPLLLLKRMGILKKPIIVINVALLHPKNATGNKRRLWAWLLPMAQIIICYASAQTAWLQAEFQLDSRNLFFIPLGVDTHYFQEAAWEEPNEFCLSVGTNNGKDFATLVKALPQHIKLIVVTDDYNAQIVKENASPHAQIEIRQAVPISELKQLYSAAKMHIIPIREMHFSSGQTVLLENMSLGKTMIVSDTSAVRDYVKNGKTAICVAPYDVDQLREQMQKVWDNPKEYAHIGANAAQSVREHFSTECFADSILKILQQIGSS
jgi:glycosyltransferase involved in cell wall biosynthesis